MCSYLVLVPDISFLKIISQNHFSKSLLKICQQTKAHTRDQALPWAVLAIWAAPGRTEPADRYGGVGKLNSKLFAANSK